MNNNAAKIKLEANETTMVERLIKETRKEIKPSDLWLRLMGNRLTSEDRYVLAKLVKSIAQSEENLGLLVFTESSYYDTNNKDQNF